MRYSDIALSSDLIPNLRLTRELSNEQRVSEQTYKSQKAAFSILFLLNSLNPFLFGSRLGMCHDPSTTTTPFPFPFGSDKS